jgi:hypothetical protein
VFLDLDGIRDSAGALKPFLWASKILSTVEGRAGYREIRDRGIHAICRGSLPAGRRQFDLPDAEHTGFGFTTNRGSLNFTGSALPQSGAIQVFTPELASLDRELFPPKATANGSRGEGPLARTDSELPEHARHAANGQAFSRLWDGDWQYKYASQSETDLALCYHLAFWTRRDSTRIDRCTTECPGIVLFVSSLVRRMSRSRSAPCINSRPCSTQSKSRVDPPEETEQIRGSGGSEDRPVYVPAGFDPLRHSQSALFYQLFFNSIGTQEPSS